MLHAECTSDSGPCSHDNKSCWLICKSETNLILVAVINAVVLAQEWISKDPHQRNSDKLRDYSQLAFIILVGIVRSTENIELRPQAEFLATQGDRDIWECPC